MIGVLGPTNRTASLSPNVEDGRATSPSMSPQTAMRWRPKGCSMAALMSS